MEFSKRIINRCETIRSAHQNDDLNYLWFQQLHSRNIQTNRNHILSLPHPHTTDKHNNGLMCASYEANVDNWIFGEQSDLLNSINSVGVRQFHRTPHRNISVRKGMTQKKIVCRKMFKQRMSIEIFEQRLQHSVNDRAPCFLSSVFTSVGTCWHLFFALLSLHLVISVLSPPFTCLGFACTRIQLFCGVVNNNAKQRC